ncbi:unnamed protein product [Oncorhynchus mykiss]|uniref:Uncharacterized protein n=1 Tax=Oncorhynchus mykiss TaxID=8022 RepID=A0A060X5G3_ONCMY|nr:unnamed protein product [Oncorhynchus mykiss]
MSLVPCLFTHRVTAPVLSVSHSILYFSMLVLVVRRADKSELRRIVTEPHEEHLMLC